MRQKKKKKKNGEIEKNSKIILEMVFFPGFVVLGQFGFTIFHNIKRTCKRNRPWLFYRFPLHARTR